MRAACTPPGRVSRESLAFVRSGGVVVNVAQRTRPLTLFPCRSDEPCAMVLEVNGGWAAAASG